MLTRNAEMFLMIPGESEKKFLRPGKTVEIEGLIGVCEFESPMALEVGDNVVLFAEVRQKFMQQGAVVTLIRQTEPTPVVAFQRIGEPVSAESRGTYRVSTVTSGLIVKVGKENKCPLLDVTPEGFGALTKAELMIGSRIPVVLAADGTPAETMVRVQTKKERPDGTFRMGFLVEDRRDPLRKALQRIYAQTQQLQLRRLAGIA